MALTDHSSPPTDSPSALFEHVVEEFRLHHPDQDDHILRRAYALADSAHTGQSRKSGEPYITHPLIVTGILAEYGMDGETLAAALLHDTVEDTEVTLDQIIADFGETVARLIDGVTKLDKIEFSTPEQHQAATIRKMVIAMAQDIRVLLIKLVDRLHNIRTVDALRQEKQERVAQQTLDVYAPLAHRLGVQEVKHELEERCFGVLYPKRKSELEDLVGRRAPQREAYIAEIIDQIRELLADAGIGADVSGRPKHLYSIYRKMVDSGLQFDEIHDLIGVRIITKDVRDCYAALGLVHTRWPPVHGRFKDYIATPKFNLYQSLHTTVVGPDGKPLEVQIRTEEMHERAEYGIAAHWQYKDGETGELGLVADIRYLQEEYPDPEEFLANLKLDLYQDEVFALTPKGDVVSLPLGATPVDFAYRIHTEVGHRTVGAKVNGRLVTLSTALESGDIVEIITSNSPEARPSRDWLNFVKSSRASSKIRQWFSKERRDQALHDGREAVFRGLAREGLGLKAAARDRVLTAVAESFGYSDLEAMFVATGDGNLNAGTVVARVVKEVKPEEATGDDLLSAVRPSRRRRRPTKGVIVEGLDDVLVRIARCCGPVPGDDIVGFVTVGRGVSVHRSDCANVTALGERMERMIEVAWAPDQGGSFVVWIQVEALDRPRLLKDVTTVVSDLGGNILASSSSTGRDRIAVLRYEVELSDPAVLDRLLADVKGVDGVFDAYRLVPQVSD